MFLGIAVSRWLTRYCVERLAFRIIRDHRRTGTHRFGLTVLWMLWALAGTTGQAALALNSSVALFAASLLNAAAIATLMWLEPKPTSRYVYS